MTVLADKAFEAVTRTGVSALAVVGGVSANSRLRGLVSARAESRGVRLSLPGLQFCTDNAAMIAFAGQRAYRAGYSAAWDLEAEAQAPLLQIGTWEADRLRRSTMLTGISRSCCTDPFGVTPCSSKRIGPAGRGVPILVTW